MQSMFVPPSVVRTTHLPSLSLSFSVLVCDIIIAGIVLVLQQGSTITSLSQISSVILFLYCFALTMAYSCLILHAFTITFCACVESSGFSGKLAAMEEELIEAFAVFHVVLKSGSSLLDRRK